MRISSSHRIFERFLTWTFLPRHFFLPRLPSLILTLLGGEGADKEAQQPAKDKPSEDSLTIRDVVSQAKEAESKSRTEGACSEAANSGKDAAKDKVKISRCRIFFHYFIVVFLWPLPPFVI